MKLFDAHCHPVSPETLERAAAAGVAGIALCGTSPDDWQQVLQLVDDCSCSGKKAAMLRPMIGIHPWFVNCREGPVTPPETAPKLRCGCRWENEVQCLEKRLRDHPGIGIGECGLDFGDKFQNRAEQEACFMAHLELARELNRPVAVHCVRAWGRLVEILREHPMPKKILHAFSGAVELIPELAELNCYFSFCGNVTNPNAKRVHAAASAVPSERLLIETDSPDFPPAGTSAPNEPANLIHVARAVAELRGVSVEDVAETTFANAERLFDVNGSAAKEPGS